MGNAVEHRADRADRAGREGLGRGGRRRSPAFDLGIGILICDMMKAQSAPASRTQCPILPRRLYKDFML